MVGSKPARYLVMIMGLLIYPDAGCSQVTRDGKNTYLVDRQGQKWNISQAVSIGFEPERFEFGLGRHAFSPLDDTLLVKPEGMTADSTRILGVSDSAESKAFSLSSGWADTRSPTAPSEQDR